jgi:hypothetical protein
VGPPWVDEAYLHIGGPEGRAFRAKRRLAYRATAAALTLLVAAAVVDATGAVDVYGPDTSTVRDRGGGFDLAVRYGTVSRPALSTPFEITVTRAGGFDDEPVHIAVLADYLLMWDLNGIVPAPAAEVAQGDWVVWEMDPPPTGDVLHVVYEARVEPGEQSGRDGEVAILVDDEPVASVTFETRLRP